MPGYRAQVIVSLTLDCNDLDREADFWAAALRYEVVERHDDCAALAPGSPLGGPRLYLQRVPEPKAVKNRMHVDWEVEDMEGEAVRLEALGATRCGGGSLGRVRWISMQDPEGNEFCVEQIFAR